MKYAIADVYSRPGRLPLLKRPGKGQRRSVPSALGTANSRHGGRSRLSLVFPLALWLALCFLLYGTTHDVGNVSVIHRTLVESKRKAPPSHRGDDRQSTEPGSLTRETVSSLRVSRHYDASKRQQEEREDSDAASSPLQPATDQVDISETSSTLDVVYAPTDAFCVDWSTDADEWWTRRPDWEVFNESADAYCFRPIANTRKASVLRRIYQNQFHGNCRKVVAKRMWSTGFGADLDNLVDGLMYGLTHGRPFQVYTSPLGWHYAAPRVAGRVGSNTAPAAPVCPTKDMFCYFLALGSCQAHQSDVADKTFLSSSRFDQWTTAEIYWHLVYLLRQRTWLRRRIHGFVQAHHALLAQPCTAIHVRRGDVVLHDNHSRRYHPIEEYVNITDEDFPIYDNILLLTDDANAIHEAQHKFPDKNWMFINRTRFHGPEGGWENPMPSNDPAYEMVVLLGTLQMVQQCQSYVHTTSNLGHIFAGAIHNANRSIPILNLDAGKPFADIVNPQNQASHLVSSVWKEPEDSMLRRALERFQHKKKKG